MDTAVLESDSKDALDGGAIEPAGGTGVPGPATTTGQGAVAIDVGGDDIGFYAVVLGGFRVLGVADRVQEVEATQCVVAAIELGQSHDDPGGGMGVLATVFANAGRIGL